MIVSELIQKYPNCAHYRVDGIEWYAGSLVPETLKERYVEMYCHSTDMTRLIAVTFPDKIQRKFQGHSCN